MPGIAHIFPQVASESAMVTNVFVSDTTARVVAVVLRRRLEASVMLPPVQTILLFSLTGSCIASVDCEVRVCVRVCVCVCTTRLCVCVCEIVIVCKYVGVCVQAVRACVCVCICVASVDNEACV